MSRPPFWVSVGVVLLTSCAPGPVAPVAPSTPSAPSPSAVSARTPSAATAKASASVEGIDVSAYQPRVDWARWRREGIRFVWIKATEGATWRSPTFPAQRTGARAAGLLQGAYHYARPKSSTGAAQARFFVRNGGRWTADGRTLPGALDLEKNPNGAACYGLSTRDMVRWIGDFTTEYRRLTGRHAVIYVQSGWWRECAGGDESFAASNPLWLYDHDDPLGPLPPGWERATAWQYGVRGSMDRNVFLGTEADLARWARTP